MIFKESQDHKMNWNLCFRTLGAKSESFRGCILLHYNIFSHCRLCELDGEEFYFYNFKDRAKIWLVNLIIL